MLSSVPFTVLQAPKPATLTPNAETDAEHDSDLTSIGVVTSKEEEVMFEGAWMMMELFETFTQPWTTRVEVLDVVRSSVVLETVRFPGISLSA